EEKSILNKYKADNPIDNIGPVISTEDILNIRRKVEQVHVDDSIQDYIVQIIQATRTHKDVYLGCSPRGTIALFNNSRALAFARGRGYVIPDDVKELVMCTLAHRIILKSEARIQGKNQEAILGEVLKTIRVPVVTSNG
ncbi:MAG TPA: MoxR family ATPase, partial [Candidatus Nitrosocosmicus sp.]|nr:MoxR family ATPase [Candidatus Nitrosocosmicus sp.]